MSKESIRVTTHSARAAATSKHNDRNFDTRKSDHIDSERSVNNLYWVWNKGEISGLTNEQTFEEAEEEFYENTFGKGLEARNRTYRDKGKKGFIKTMEQYHKAEQSRPEETIWMIGDMHTDVPPGVLWDIVKEEVDWRSTKYPQVVTLDLALHADEQGGLHVHDRYVWVGHDKNGNAVVGQNKALTEMGVERPDLSRDVSRYNNAKMTFTRECRDHFIELCEEHGLTIEKEPREASKSGKTMLQFQVDALEADVKALESEKSKLQDELEHERTTLERTATARIKASRIKKTFGDKDKRTYWESSINQAEDIAKEMRQYSEEADRVYSWAAAKAREAEKLKEEAEEGFELRDEYAKKKKNLDKYIEKKAKELVDQRTDSAKSNNYTQAMVDFMKQYRSLEGNGTLYDDFDRAYIERMYGEIDKGVKEKATDISDRNLEYEYDEDIDLDYD